MEGLKDYLKGLSPRGLKTSLRTKKEYMSFLIEKYGHDVDISEMAYMFMNDMDTKPVASCGDACKFENVSIGYADFCCKPKFGKDKCIPCSKTVQDRKKATFLKIYGVDNPAKSKEIRMKMDKTNLDKFGTTKPQRLQEIKDKSTKTNIEKYGVEHSSQLDNNKELRKNTMMEKYGVSNALLTGKASLEYRYEKYYDKYFKYGFKLLSSKDDFEKIGAHGILNWECIDCGRNMSKVDQCLRCPSCNPYSSSSEEIELRNYIESILPDEEIKYNVRNVIENREIDIYIPSMNVGIEYSGDYWHSTIHKEENYHQEKCIMLKQQGGKLITIFGSQWNIKNKIVKHRLKHILQNSKTTVYARNATVREVNSVDCSEFLNNYHIQGTCQSSIRYGLYVKETLIAVMTFGKPRFNNEHQYELIRFASSCSIPGGASKLLKHFERTVSPSSLLSYADMNWSTGNLYTNLGFTEIGMTKPSYFYFDRKTNSVYSRFKLQKRKLIEKYNFSPTMTAEQMIDTLGYFKVYDCGSLIFSKKYK